MKKKIIITIIFIALVLSIAIFYKSQEKSTKTITNDFDFETIDLKTNGDVINYEVRITNNANSTKKINEVILKFVDNQGTIAEVTDKTMTKIESHGKILVSGETKGTLNGRKASKIISLVNEVD